jgi:hypothetical protein
MTDGSSSRSPSPSSSSSSPRHFAHGRRGPNFCWVKFERHHSSRRRTPNCWASIRAFCHSRIISTAPSRYTTHAANAALLASLSINGSLPQCMSRNDATFRLSASMAFKRSSWWMTFRVAAGKILADSLSFFASVSGYGASTLMRVARVVKVPDCTILP